MTYDAPHDQRHEVRSDVDQLDDREGRRLDREIRSAAPGDVTEDQAWAVINAFEAFTKTHRVSVASVARSLGYHQSTLATTLRMRYRGNWRAVILDLDRWLEDQPKTPAKPAEFVDTRVASRLYAMAELAMRSRRISVAYGPSGIGKTFALRALAADKPGSVFVSLKTFAATPSGVVDSIAAGLGIIDPKRPRSISSRLAAVAIEEVLRGTGRLLIVDEVHKVMHRRNHAAMTVRRDLFDQTGCPQLWCSKIDGVSFLSAECGPREPLSQIRTRIIKCADLAEGITPGSPGGDGGPDGLLFTIDEVRQFIANRKTRFVPAAERELCRIINASDGGYLRTLDALLFMVETMHGRASPVTAAAVLAAARMLQLDHVDERPAAVPKGVASAIV